MNRRLWGLFALLLLSCAFYMLWGVRAPWSFVLPFRGAKLGALILVGCTVSTASLLFQTITQNRILTPSIMGFDALYLLLLSGAVFWLGGMTVAGAPPQIVFLVTASALIIASLLLFGTLMRSVRGDLLRMVLTGIIFGALFRSLTSFLERMIDPNEFAVVQAASFARFTQIETDLLALSAGVSGLALLRCWVIRHRLDVLALGRDTAMSLGEPPRRLELESLILIAILVSVSTALVGPLAFLGLLVLSLARLITPSEKHAILIPSAGLIAAITLVGGQAVMEHVMALSTPLVVVIDLLGGAVFLALLLKGSGR
ncbi:enterobactin ABC transporter permease [Loktanella sp. D2R18]|uniref:iron chelate uptake ABC transporter family permease subunit n=1 Tax=Rhodobacterales TaxID=204455 RepID=UPI000DEA04AC|nr:MULTISPECIES: iron chelate uptake ABC transporter family permease subunit [Rhodobacterales]MDO6589847.1 iron chelate uptake ABC transporter family permease subunit [Yoonia sp. 1_MG-2023]RBW45999.1 enterobactin ABC transporter permease [Loktanella sp. D2R18]